MSTSNQHVCIYCDIVDIAVFGDIVSALCQYRHRGNIVPIFPFTLLISSISPKCYRRTWNQYPLYHQCYLKMIRYGIWRHKLLYVFKKIAKYLTFSYTIQYTELFNSSWVKYTCIHVRLKMDQDHPSFKYMYSVLIKLHVLLRLTTCGLFRNQPKHYVYSYMYKRAQTDFRLLKGAVTFHLWKSYLLLLCNILIDNTINKSIIYTFTHVIWMNYWCWCWLCILSAKPATFILAWTI